MSDQSLNRPNKPRRGENPEVNSRGIREYAQKIRDLAAKLEEGADSMVAIDIESIKPTVQRFLRLLDELDEKIESQFLDKIAKAARRKGLKDGHRAKD